VTLAAVPASAATLEGRVTRVVDGDTVKVEVRGVETTVRLVGIDTPETVRPGTPVECFGPAASARTKLLLRPGQAVRLLTDPTQDVRDRYGRLLAYVYEPGRAGARGSVNYALVAGGYAKVDVYEGKPFVAAPAFFRAQHRARVARAGLWGPACNGNTTKPALISRRAPKPSPHPAGGCNPMSRLPRRRDSVTPLPKRDSLQITPFCPTKGGVSAVGQNPPNHAPGGWSYPTTSPWGLSSWASRAFVLARSR
jgi:micrococcal nuclease